MDDLGETAKTATTRRHRNKGPISTITRGLDLGRDGKIVRTSLPLHSLRPCRGEDSLRTQLEAGAKSMCSEWKESRFSFEAELGVGGQGAVYAIADRDCGRSVAMKVLSGRRVQPENIARFIHEAQVTAQLEHPGIVPVHDMGALEDGTLYYTMECVGGSALADVLPSLAGRLEHRYDLLQTFLKVCDTMEFAHSHGVVHRDLKPRNIMVAEFGEVLVVDWGLAKVLGSSDVASLRSKADEGSDIFQTRQGLAVGTPAYMSPEQARGKGDKVSIQSDIYALGVILYEMLTGYSPYHPLESSRQVIRAVAESDWRPLDKVEEHLSIPPQLVAMVHKAMAADPSERYENIGILASDLRNFLAGASVSVYQESLAERLLRWARTHRQALITTGGVTAAALISLLGMKFWQDHREFTRLNELKNEARVAEYEERYEDALRSLEQVAEARPQDAEIRNRIVDIKVQQNEQRRSEEAQLTEAAREVERRNNIRAQAKRAEALEAEGLTLLALGDDQIEAAVTKFAQALGSVPAQDEYAETRNRILEAHVEASTRVKELEREADRQRGLGLLTEAEKLLVGGDASGARASLDKALEWIPADETSQALASRIDNALIAEQQSAARGLMDRARQSFASKNYEESVRLIHASMAVSVLPGASELLAEAIAEKAKAEEERRIKAVLARASSLASMGNEALKSRNLVAAQQFHDDLLDHSQLHSADRHQWEAEEATLKAGIQVLTEELARGRAEALLVEASKQFTQLRGLQESCMKLKGQRSDLQRSLLTRGVDAHAVRREIAQLGKEIQQQEAQSATLTGTVAGLLLEAHSTSPGHLEVRRQLADYYAHQVRLHDSSGNTAAAAAAAAQGKTYDSDGAHQSLFEGKATVHWRGEGSLGLSPVKATDTNEVPIQVPQGGALEVPHGRYVVRTDGGVTRAINLIRGETTPVALPRSVPLPKGFSYIPGGAIFDQSGQPDENLQSFFLKNHEVTVGEYLEFLNDPQTLAEIERRPYEFMILAPRATWNDTTSYWLRSGDRYLAQVEVDGDRVAVDPRLPMTGISHQDVLAYIAWLRQQDDRPYRLPTEAEWRLAMQGGDGRRFPWGDTADPGLCYSLISAPTVSGSIEQPIGSFPSDRSVQGIFDLAGSVAEFVSDPVPGDERLVRYCGGSFSDREPERFSAFSTRGVDRRLVIGTIGFRLALDHSP